MADRIIEPSASLIDYVLINTREPQIYAGIPSVDAKMALTPGTAVKIGLAFDDGRRTPHPEHFWVEIVERRGVAGFVGKVLNRIQPEFHVPLDALLAFGSHHIREIDGSPNPPGGDVDPDTGAPA